MGVGGDGCSVNQDVADVCVSMGALGVGVGAPDVGVGVPDVGVGVPGAGVGALVDRSGSKAISNRVSMVMLGDGGVAVLSSMGVGGDGCRVNQDDADVAFVVLYDAVVGGLLASSGSKLISNSVLTLLIGGLALLAGVWTLLAERLALL